jgi:hypothetical protein
MRTARDRVFTISGKFFDQTLPLVAASRPTNVQRSINFPFDIK